MIGVWGHEHEPFLVGSGGRVLYGAPASAGLDGGVGSTGTKDDLQAIAGDGVYLYAVGDYDTLLRYSDGSGWTRLTGTNPPPPRPPGPVFGSVHEGYVAVVDAGDLWLLGLSDASDDTGVHETTFLTHSTDGGKTFTRHALGSGVPGGLASGAAGLIVVGSGDFAGAPETTGAIRSVDGGATWKPLPITGFARAVAMDDTDAWIAVDHRIFHSRDAGATWTEEPTGLRAGDTIDALAACGGGEAYAAADNGTILHN
jgi:photosystem II stability/assembly factor-like uncharacterized protein